MNKQTGFTLLELLVTLSIIGILTATALPVYNTWQSRARGTEAALMIKQIMEAQIMYFLEHEKFFPEDEDDNSIEIYHDTAPDHIDIKELEEKLHVLIPTGHFLEYTLTSNNTSVPADKKSFTLAISEYYGRELFKDVSLVISMIDENGEVTTNVL